LRESDTREARGDKRSEGRRAPSPDCHAVVRVSGIPINQFKLRDISRNGTCFLVEEDSSILRHLRAGVELEIQFRISDSGQPSEFHRSEIIHITRANQDQFKGNCLVGVRIISRLKLR
jgi:hypothetical protein